MAPASKNVKIIGITAAVVTGVSIGAYMSVDALLDNDVAGVSQKATTRESGKKEPDKSDKDLGFDFEIEEEDEIYTYDDLVDIASKSETVDSATLFAYQNEENVNEYAFNETDEVQAKINNEGQFAFNEEQMDNQNGIDNDNTVVAIVEPEREPVKVKPEQVQSENLINPQPEPEQPTIPVNPQPEPEQPTIPVNPQPEPELPSIPVNPQPEPEQPTIPVNPQPEPERPTIPVIPPVKPERPTEPVDPPVEPEQPTEPVDPPVKPEQPTEPVDPPVKPEQPTEPVDPPVEPEQPTEPVDPPVVEPETPDTNDSTLV